MAAGTSTHCVELSVVITNESTLHKMLRAVEQLAEIADDYPWLDLSEPLDDIEDAIRELTYEPTR